MYATNGEWTKSNPIYRSIFLPLSMEAKFGWTHCVAFCWIWKWVIRLWKALDSYDASWNHISINCGKLKVQRDWSSKCSKFSLHIMKNSRISVSPGRSWSPSPWKINFSIVFAKKHDPKHYQLSPVHPVLNLLLFDPTVRLLLESSI